MLQLRKPFLTGATAIVFFSSFFFAFFWPVISADAILAVGDGLIYYWPAFENGLVVWDGHILSGYPAFADPQRMLWYPLRALSPNFNVLVASAYVVGASGTYFVARCYGASMIAAAAAGITYSLSGFMVAHLGHTSIIHAAAWIPWVVLSVERATIGHRKHWAAVGALAIACSFLSGHPQPTFYGLIAVAALMLLNFVNAWRKDRRSGTMIGYAYVAMTLLGVALATVQLVPTIMFADQTVRAEMRFEDFVTYQLPSDQIAMVFFPFLFGPNTDASIPYFGAWNFTEVAPYVGLSTFTLILASVALQKSLKFYFWLGVAVFALVYALGDATPLARIAFELPIISGFRAPARMAGVFSLAVSLLVAFALIGFENSKLTKRDLVKAAGLGIAGLALTLLLAVSVYPSVLAKSSNLNIALPEFIQNEAILGPSLAAFVMLTWLLICNAKKPALVAGAAAIMAIELWTHGQNLEWRHSSGVPEIADVSVDLLAAELVRDNGRILPVSGAMSPSLAVSPNFNSVNSIPSASGYGPLLPSRYAELTQITTSGQFPFADMSRSVLQAMGVTHIIANLSERSSVVFQKECGGARNTDPVHINLPRIADAAFLTLKSNLACSVTTKQGAPTISIQPTLEGNPIGKPLLVRAGLETAEWAIRRSDVASAISHQEPKESEVLPGTDGVGRLFISSLPLSADQSTFDGLSISFQMTSGAISINHLAIENANAVVIADALPNLFDRRPVGDLQIAGSLGPQSDVFRFFGGKGYSWLVNDIRYLSSKNALDAIRSGQYADESKVDLTTTAIVDMPVAPSTRSLQAEGSVLVESRGGTSIDLVVNSSASNFLVISEQFHPGWTARLNGEPVPILRTNYAFMGAFVPEGQSVLELRFRPFSLLLGSAISIIAALGCLILLVWRGPHTDSASKSA